MRRSNGKNREKKKSKKSQVAVKCDAPGGVAEKITVSSAFGDIPMISCSYTLPNGREDVYWKYDPAYHPPMQAGVTKLSKCTAGLIEKWGRGTNRVIEMCKVSGIALALESEPVDPRL